MRARVARMWDTVAGLNPEVVVDLVTAALNRRDWWIWRAPSTPVPVTLGSDGAGRVSAALKQAMAA